MSRGINKVILVGNIGNDPEMRYSQGGMAIASVSLATTSVRKDRDGNQVESTQWHRVKFFGKVAEVIGEHAKKGTQLYVEGRIEYSTSGEGDEKKYYTDIIADQFQFVGGKSDGGGGSQRESRASRAPASRASRASRRDPPAAEQSRSGDVDDEFEDDDIPF